jgi:hypothetical protein
VIPDLLWRCPLCASNDAIRHSQRWLHLEVVDCSVCGAQWRVRRVVGDNHYLKIVRAGRNPTAYPPGTELSITAWYDLMKQTVHLEALPVLPKLLEAGERLYLASGQATLWPEAQPAFSRIHPFSPAGEIPSLSGAETVNGQASLGQLFFTNQRMIWQPSSMPATHSNPSEDPRPFTFPLHQVNGIYAILNLGLSMVVGTRLYYLRFATESPLKWVTYVALLAPQIKAESGHQIRTSHF